jgi:hypothetical protein
MSLEVVDINTGEDIAIGHGELARAGVPVEVG